MTLLSTSMHVARSFKPETRAAIVCVMLGLLVSAAMSPKNAYFFSNMAFYSASQIGMLALLLPFKPRPAIVAGAAFALAVYLAAFGTWQFTRSSPQSMSWLGYVFSLPGAAICTVVVAIVLRGQAKLRPFAAACISAGAVLGGIFVNQVVVCSTLMYCGGK